MDGLLVTPRLPGRRAELVFAYLAVEHRRAVTRDELADALWPESLPGAWAAGLRGIVSDVRQFLGECGLPVEDVLVSAQGGYALRLPVGVGTDLDAAREAAAAAEADVGADPARSVAGADAVLALTQLGFLPALEGEWVDGVRREVETLGRRALAASAAARSRTGDARGAAAAAERLVRAAPFDETAHQLRIRILGEAGDRAGARLAYEECATVLGDELGATPSPVTERVLGEALAAGAGNPAAPAVGVAPAGVLAGAPTAGVPTAGVPESVLVVEDHAFQRRTAAHVLRSLGVTEVLEASDGASALALLGRVAPPDVILCDIDMPGMDGVEFVRRIGEQGVASSVVITSALESSVLHAVEAVGAGYGLTVLGSIEKPLSAASLRLVLGRHTSPCPTSADGGDRSTAELERALQRHEIRLAFEPTVDLATGLAWSALVRVLGRDGVPLSGHVMVPALTRPETASRLVDALTAGASAAVAAWIAAGSVLAATLPLPGVVLGDVTVVERVTAIVEATGAVPSAVVWDVDAAAVRRDPTVALDVLTRLRLRGFGLSLRIANLVAPTVDPTAGAPVTEVRFGGRLVAGVAGSAARRDLLERMVGEVRGTGLPVTAGGCDGPADFDALLSLGCQRIHGRYVAAPMPAADLPAWADTWAAGAWGDLRA